MTMTTLPTPPSRGDSPADFAAKADSLLGALPTFVTEANALETNVVAKEASAVAAANSASTNAGTASSAATTATTQAGIASSAATAAAASYDAFDDRYLGSYAANPTLDNDGNTLLVGALYWNTGASELRVWTGSVWVGCSVPGGVIPVASGGTGATTAAGARAALGVVPGTDVQVYDSATAKTNVDQQYSKPQRTTPLGDNDLSFDIGSTGAQDFVCTPTAGGTLTFTNIRAGAKGEILLVNTGNYIIAKAATVKCPSSMLATISATGRYRLAYSCLDGTNVDVTASGALA